MPRIKSAKKAMRQNIKRRVANKNKKNILKSLTKDFKKHCAQKNKDKAKELLTKCCQAFDKSTKTNLIHKNKARRLKSRLSKLYNTI